MSALIFAFFLSLPATETGGELCPLVQDLNAWVARSTNHTPPSCPTIGFSALPATGALRSQAGAFYPNTGAIELAPDLDLSTAYGQSYLLHELVHAAQYASGAERSAACPAQLEAEAYAVQSDFLHEHGLGREAVMMRLLAQQLGTCAD